MKIKKVTSCNFLFFRIMWSLTNYHSKIDRVIRFIAINKRFKSNHQFCDLNHIKINSSKVLTPDAISYGF